MAISCVQEGVWCLRLGHQERLSQVHSQTPHAQGKSATVAIVTIVTIVTTITQKLLHLTILKFSIALSHTMLPQCAVSPSNVSFLKFRVTLAQHFSDNFILNADQINVSRHSTYPCAIDCFLISTVGILLLFIPYTSPSIV